MNFTPCSMKNKVAVHCLRGVNNRRSVLNRRPRGVNRGSEGVKKFSTLGGVLSFPVSF